MRHKLLLEYSLAVEQAVEAMQGAHVEHYAEEILTPERANLRIRIRFANGCLLEVNEAAIVEADQLVPLNYRYHCQNQQNRLLFRYDDTPHFPSLSSFPHHKHLPGGAIATEKPTIFDMLKEGKAAIQRASRTLLDAE
jgi:hypothetical protein